jgi:hypothetical protein
LYGKFVQAVDNVAAMKKAKLVAIVLGGGAKLHQKAIAFEIAELLPGIFIDDDINVAEAVWSRIGTPLFDQHLAAVAIA